MARPGPRGFTYVELIIYVFLVGAILLVFASFIIDVLVNRTRSKNSMEVQQNARLAAERITQAVRYARGINAASSTFGANLALPANAGKILSLNMATSSLDPTIFAVDNYVLVIKEGTAATAPLTSREIQVTNLVFTNYSTSTKTRNIGFDITAALPNPAFGAVYAVSSTLRSTVELRNR